MARYWPACLFLIAWTWTPAALARQVDVRLESAQLQISAPGVHFLSGDSLRKLQDGAPVIFGVKLSLLRSRYGEAQTSVMGRFIVSYDLWEEKFTVKKTGTDARSISHLTRDAAERWCLDQMGLPSSGLAPAEQFWVSVEVAVEEPQQASGDPQDSAFTLGTLIDIFSRKSRGDGSKATEAFGGPFRLENLRRSP